MKKVKLYKTSTQQLCIVVNKIIDKLRIIEDKLDDIEIKLTSINQELGLK